MKSQIKSALQRGLGLLFKPEAQKLADYAEEHFYLSPESSSEVGRWECVAYQRGIMNLISNEEVEVLTWQKSARVGYTKIITAAINYFAEHKKRNQVLYQPTDDDRDAFVKDEIEPMIRDVPVMRSIFPWYGLKHKNNTLDKKKFIGSTLHLLGGKSARNYRRITVDVAFYDELAAFDNNVDGEGSPTSLGDTRLETSSFPKSIRGSTPKIEGICQIAQSLADADVVLVYRLPCPCCDELQHLEWGGKDVEHGFKWDDNDPKTARYHCIHCGESFTYEFLPPLLERGSWQTECGSVIYDEDADLFKNAEGEIIPTPRHVGIKLWSAYSLFSHWPKLVREFLQANKKSKAGDIGQLITFVNTKRGETWADETSEQIDDNALYNRRESYPVDDGKLLAPEGVLYITIGIDTQDDRFEFEVVGWGVGEESWSLDYRVLYGDLSQPQIWNILQEMISQQYKTADGRTLDVGLIGQDSGGHYTTEVYKFSRKVGIYHLIPLKGSSGYGKPIANMPRKKNAQHGVYLTEVDTNAAKDLIYKRLALQAEDVRIAKPGYCHFPIAESHDEKYFSMLCAEKKVLRITKGKRIYAYECPKGVRNEALDCRVYAVVALRIAQQRFGVDLDKLAEKAANKTPAKKANFADLGRKFNS